MRRLASLAAIAAVAGAGFLAASPAEAYCPNPSGPVVPCYSLVGDCLTVRVYTTVAGSPSNTICPHT